MSKSIIITGLASALLILSGAVSAAGGMMSSDEEDTMTFEGLDTNGDGYISAEEAAYREDLTQNWKRIDTDNDNQLDSSEFSAFEGEGRMTPPEESEIPEPGAAPYEPSTSD